MTLRKALVKTLVASACVLGMLVFGSSALAHWEPGDGHKMHFPQLPDPAGWDIGAAQGQFICQADDYMCSETGKVTDIHVWGSWKGGEVGWLSFL